MVNRTMKPTEAPLAARIFLVLEPPDDPPESFYELYYPPLSAAKNLNEGWKAY